MPSFLHLEFGVFTSYLLTNPNLKYAKIIGEPMSDEQGMKIFSKLALSKQYSKIIKI